MREKERRWQRRNVWVHFLSWKHQNHHELLNNPRQNRLETKKKKKKEKIFYTQRQRRFHKTVGGSHSWYKQIPYILIGWVTHRLENNYIEEVFPQEWEFWTPCGFLAWGTGIGRGSPQSIWLWKPVGLECRSSMGLKKRETNASPSGWET